MFLTRCLMAATFVGQGPPKWREITSFPATVGRLSSRLTFAADRLSRTFFGERPLLATNARNGAPGRGGVRPVVTRSRAPGVLVGLGADRAGRPGARRPARQPDMAARYAVAVRLAHVPFAVATRVLPATSPSESARCSCLRWSNRHHWCRHSESPLSRARFRDRRSRWL